MGFRFLAVFVFQLLLLNAFAQSGSPSLFEQADHAFTLASRNSDSAVLLARDVIAKSHHSRNDSATANALNALGWANMHQGRLDSAVYFLEQSRDMFSTQQRPDDIVRVSINLSELYTKQSNLSAALKCLMTADSICVKTGNLAFHTNVKRQFGIIYREAGDYKKSADYFSQALDGFLKLGDHFRYVGTGISYSILLRNMKMMDSCILVLNKCLDVARQFTKSRYQVAMIEEHLGETSFATADYHSALQHFSNAYHIFDTLNNRADVAFELFSMGKTLGKLNRYREAEERLLLSIAISDSLGIINFQYDATSELATLHKDRGQWQQAYTYLEKAGILKDSLDLTAQKRLTAELKEQFEAEKKEKEIVQLKANNDLADAAHKRTRLRQYVFILLFAAAVVIGWLMVIRSRIKKRLDAELLRNQIAADLHDDIGSALSSIDISSRVALVKRNTDVTTDQLVKIQENARHTMDRMGDIVWSINPARDNMESLLMRMREFAANLCEAANVTLHFHSSDGLDGLVLDANRRKNIFLVFKEAVNNAIKYSQCKNIFVQVSLPAKNKVAVEIKDDGTGFDIKAVKRGNGLDNMEKRAALLDGMLTLTSNAGVGTVIKLECRL